VWLLTRRLTHKHRPEETLTVILVPTAWRTAIWQCVCIVSAIWATSACSTSYKGALRGRECGRMYSPCVAHASHVKRASLERLEEKGQ
jgi:hypothetical protein